MKSTSIARTLALAAALATTAGSALAQAPTNAEYYAFKEIMSMRMMDKDKDGMVSRAEYMDMMGKAWDMNAAKMGVKGDRMTSQQFQEILMYMRAGG